MGRVGGLDRDGTCRGKMDRGGTCRRGGMDRDGACPSCVLWGERRHRTASQHADKGAHTAPAPSQRQNCTPAPGRRPHASPHTWPALRVCHCSPPHTWFRSETYRCRGVSAPQRPGSVPARARKLRAGTFGCAGWGTRARWPALYAGGAPAPMPETTFDYCVGFQAAPVE